VKTRKYVLAIDQGTTGTHVLVIDDQLRVLGTAYRELRQYFPKPGWVEHDLNEIWRSAVDCVERALRNARVRASTIAAIGITNQRETTGLWLRDSGKPVHRAIVWQDRRTAERCASLKSQGLEARVRATTGLVLDPYFSGTKLAWLLDNVAEARAKADRGDLCFGTVDSWLVYKLTGHRSHLTDVSNASRTLLMDLRTLSWDPEMIKLLDIPGPVLPEIRGSAEIYGTTLGVRSLPDGIPVAGMAGDQQAALFGQACFAPGEAKCTYGTGAFLLMNTGEIPVESHAGLLTTVGWRIFGRTVYALEGSAFVAGAAVQWLRDGLGLIKSAPDVEKLARKVDDTGALVFVPALTGLGAPHWRPDARGLLAGVDRSTSAGHLARAVLEGIAFQIHDLARAMTEDSGREIPAFKVDGGASANGLLMQFQADLLGTDVVRPRNLQTTSLGAAFLAGLGSGVWKNEDEIRGAWKEGRRFRARMTPEVREHHLNKWRRALQRV
jgi:glycerol kinase